jgi:hypothetical protein
MATMNPPLSVSIAYIGGGMDTQPRNTIASLQGYRFRNPLSLKFSIFLFFVFIVNT